MEQSRKHPLSERLEYNRLVEQARIAHHQRRCEESPIYKRVYEKMLQFSANNLKFQVFPCNIMQGKNIESQQLRDTSSQNIHPLLGIDDVLSYAIIATMFADEGFLSRLKEEIPFLKEYSEIEAYYYNQLEPISGWEI